MSVSMLYGTLQHSQ